MIAVAAMGSKARPEYASLLSESLPAVIRSEAQNERALEQIAGLLERESSLTRAEKALLQLLTLLVEAYEEQTYQLPRASPLAVLAFLMDQHSLRQKDLSDVFRSPSITSEVLNGKRELNKEQIRRLSGRFHVSPEVFF